MPSRSPRPARCSSGSWPPASGRPPAGRERACCAVGGAALADTLRGVARRDRAEEDPHSGVHLAHLERTPLRQVWRRVVLAVAVLVVTVAIIYLDRDGYRDLDERGLSLLDSLYYATVTLSTTGYGDITPVTASARLVNILVITPLRIAFLLILIGTTLEALTARSQEEFRIRRWRSRVRQHVVVCGYGTKGRSAIRALPATGTPAEQIVVGDPDPAAGEEAAAAGLTAIAGDAGRTEVLTRAAVQRARSVIVAANRDDAAALVTLTVRQLNPAVPITASVREEENAQLLHQSGATTVITTSATSGRLMGLSTAAPGVVAVVEDLLTSGVGLDLTQRPVAPGEVGLSPRQLRDVVLSVTRGGRSLRFDDPLIGTLQSGDVLVVVKSHGPLPMV